MTAFALQTILLLALAYLLGCWLACLLRRMTGSTRDRPVAATASQAAEAAAVARQIAPLPKVQPAEAKSPASAPAVPAAAGAPMSIAPRYPPKRGSAPARTPATVEEAINRLERTLTEFPAAKAAAPAPAATRRPAAPSTSAAHAAIAGAAAAAAAASAAATRSAPADAPAPVRVQASSTPMPAMAASAADDFKRIRTIDEGLEAALHRAGIRRYADMAAWKPEDVARISKEFGFKGRIEQDNWIEQAQILARGEDTFYSSRLARGEQASARPVADQGERARPLAAEPVAAPAVPSRNEAALAAPVAAPLAVAMPASVALAPEVRRGPPATAPSAQRTSIEAAAKTAAALAARASEARAAPLTPAPAVAPTSVVPAERIKDTASSEPIRDWVQCSAFAPPVISPRRQFMIQAWFHCHAEIEAVAGFAKAADPSSSLQKSATLRAQVPRGSEISAQLTCPDLDLDDPMQHIVWLGLGAESCAFLATLKEAAFGKLEIHPVVMLSIDGVPAGRIVCRLDVNSDESSGLVSPPLQSVGSRCVDYSDFERAFISYSSKNLDDVARIMQGIRVVRPDLKCFFAIDTLMPGDNWREKICESIRACDLFVIAWSQEAEESEEVGVEIDYAVFCKECHEGDGPSIAAIPLDGPPFRELPAHLKSYLHYGDRMQLYRAMARLAASE